jgi:hypothetical protein
MLLITIGCGQKRPADILPKQKMQEVIWDMLKTGEFLDGYVLNKDTAINKNATIEGWYDKIYQLHKITKAQFEKSYSYYQDHPAMMKEMLDTLSKRELPKVGLADSTKTPKDTSKSALPKLIPKRTPGSSGRNPGSMIDSVKQQMLRRKELK